MNVGFGTKLTLPRTGRPLDLAQRPAVVDRGQHKAYEERDGPAQGERPEQRERQDYQAIRRDRLRRDAWRVDYPEVDDRGRGIELAGELDRSRRVTSWS